jgi:hypothetical protein
MLCGRVEEHADLGAGVRDIVVVDAGDRGVTTGRRSQPRDDAHRRGLAGPVRAEEAGDGSGSAGEGDVVDGSYVAAVRLGEVFDCDHGSTLTGAGSDVIGHAARPRQPKV